MSWSVFLRVLLGTPCESVCRVILSSFFTRWVYPEPRDFARDKLVKGFILSEVEGRPDLTASAVLQRIRGGGTTASYAAPCICGNIGS